MRGCSYAALRCTGTCTKLTIDATNPLLIDKRRQFVRRSFLLQGPATRAGTA